MNKNNFITHIAGTLVNLVPSQQEHYPQLAKILSDQKTMNQLIYMSKKETGGWTIEQTKERYQKFRDNENTIDFVIIDKSSNEPVGNCGFFETNLVHKNAEFGMILHHPYWGKGIAAECRYLCLKYGFEELKLHRIQFCTFTTNKRSCTHLERIGIKQESIKKECHLQEGVFKDDAIFAVFENQWPQVKQKLLERIKKQTNKEF